MRSARSLKACNAVGVGWRRAASSPPSSPTGSRASSGSIPARFGVGTCPCNSTARMSAIAATTHGTQRLKRSVCGAVLSGWLREGCMARVGARGQAHGHGRSVRRGPRTGAPDRLEPRGGDGYWSGDPDGYWPGPPHQRPLGFGRGVVFLWGRFPGRWRVPRRRNGCSCVLIPGTRVRGLLGRLRGWFLEVFPAMGAKPHLGRRLGLVERLGGDAGERAGQELGQRCDRLGAELVAPDLPPAVRRELRRLDEFACCRGPGHVDD